jgi:hypothetical protein
MKVVVLEFGSRFIRGGFNDEHCPRFILESDIMLCSDDSNFYSEMIFMLRKIFMEMLQIKTKLYSVLVIEKLTMKQLYRDVILTILHKEFQVI